MNSYPQSRSRQLAVVGASANGVPRTYRLMMDGRRSPRSDAAYRRLAMAILGLDMASVAAQLSGGRHTA